jgi:hypothetical protein
VPRVLTSAKVEVPPGDEVKYLRLITHQANEFGARGFHLWVFRSRGEKGVFLEFREGPGPTPEWIDGGLETIRQRDLELRVVANYTGDAAVWDEVSLDRDWER